MASVLKALFVVALLVVPLLVVAELPKFFEIAGSIPATNRGADVPTLSPAFRLLEATPAASGRPRVAPLDESVPPTLAPPVATATAVATPRPLPTGERIIIGNTEGQGAVLRSDPVTGRPVAALHEQQVLDVLERRNVPGSGDWVHVRTAEGVDGWVTVLVARPVSAR